MASYVLYPPIVDETVNAFVAGNNSSCRVYFSLSKFNASTDFKSVHVSVKRQGKGTTVIKTDGTPYPTALGIALNMKSVKVEDEDNLYYIDIPNVLLDSKNDIYSGWIPGWTYEIQLRLCAADDYNGDMTQAAWVNEHGDDFSEWSIVIRTKAIGEPIIEIPPLKYKNNENMTTRVNVENLNLYGTFSDPADASEHLYAYKVKLFSGGAESILLEDSGTIFTNANTNVNAFRYNFHYEPINNTNYRIVFAYETNNGYSKSLDLFVTAVWEEGAECPLYLVNTENPMDGAGYTVTAAQESDYAFIGLKVYDKSSIKRTLTFVIRRSDSKSNFTLWEDIKKITLKNENVNNREPISDFTIESGVWYKYGIQTIDANGVRGPLKKLDKPSIRNFEFCYLLGADNKQLRFEFDETLTNFRVATMDTVQPTIDGKMPYTKRNGKSYYRTFNLNALVSFQMDDYFATRYDVYQYPDVVKLYEEYNTQNGIDNYDMMYERQFRDYVMTFLYDGKPKLFKSPSEGNIIINLSQVTFTPNETLNRLIYSFTSVATEAAELTENNLIKYKLKNVESKIGDSIGLNALSSHSKHPNI